MSQTASHEPFEWKPSSRPRTPKRRLLHAHPNLHQLSEPPAETLTYNLSSHPNDQSASSSLTNLYRPLFSRWKEHVDTMRFTTQRVILIDWTTPTLLQRSSCHRRKLYSKGRRGTKYPSLTGIVRRDPCRNRSSSLLLSQLRVEIYYLQKAGSLQRSTSPRKRRRMMMSSRTTRTTLLCAPTRSNKRTSRPCTGGSPLTRPRATTASPRRHATTRPSAPSRARRSGRG